MTTPVHLELSPETHNHFLKLKKTIEEMAGEAVTDDQVVDFLIRSMLQSVELPDEEHEGCGCCSTAHHSTEHHCCREDAHGACGCQDKQNTWHCCQH